MQLNNNREAAKTLALLFGKIDEYKYFRDDAILLFNQRQKIDQAKFAFSPLGKAFEKQTQKQVDAIKSLDISGKKDELKQIENIFSENLINELIRAKLRKIVNLKDIIWKDNLDYKWKCRKTYNFRKYSLLIAF